MEKSGLKSRLIYFLFGAVSLFSQVILARRLLGVFYGNELTIGSLFAGWMFWFGAGGVLSGRSADRSERPGRTLAYLLWLEAVVFALSAALVWFSRYIFGFSPGVMAGFGGTLLAGLLFSGPTCIILGAAFNYAARSFQADESNLVSLYLYEASGSAAAGGLSLLVAGRVSAVGQILGCSLLAALAGAMALERKKAVAWSVAIAILLFILPAVFSGRLERLLVSAQWRGQEVVLHKESKYAAITITRQAGQTTFNLDGFPAFSEPSPEFFEQLVHLPLAMCGNPERVLLIGGGLTPAAREILKHPVKELVYVQLDPELTRLEEKYLPGFEEFKRDHRVKIVHRDARIFLKENGERFDAVLVNLPGPETANLNRYYTREFFSLAQANLQKNGVLGLSAGSSGNYLSDGQAALLSNSLLTLGAVFRQVVVLPLGWNFLVAGDAGAHLTTNPELIVGRLKDAGVSTRFVREYYLRDNLNPERLASVQERAARFNAQPLNQDLRPRGYYLANLLWLEQASPGWRGFITRFLQVGVRPLVWSLLMFLALALALVFIGRKKAFANLAIFAVGFASMAAELVLILAFQVGYGYVFYLVGALLSAFMAGLAFGAYLYEKLQARIERRPLPSLNLVMAGEALALLLAVPGVSMAVQGNSAPVLTLGLIFSLLVLAAIFSGLAFPLCAHLYRSESGSGMGMTAGWVNASDHFGACLGAFTMAALLVPLFGLQSGLIFSLLLAGAALASGIALARAV